MRKASVILLVAACHRDAPAPAPPPASAPAPSPPPAPAPTRAPTPTPPPEVKTDWCIEGLHALDEETCYVLPPEGDAGPRRLLIYLHGIVPPTPESTQKTTVETVVLHTAIRAGAAALIPRGVRGIGPKEAKDWWAWPTDPESHRRLAPSILERLAAAKKKLEAIAGAPFARTYLGGSSNGAYFIAALALSGDLEGDLLPVDGYGAFSGGGTGGRRVAAKTPKPFYVGFGTYDEETKKNATTLGATLKLAGWPVEMHEHPLGHGAREVYVDEAFTFWDAR